MFEPLKFYCTLKTFSFNPTDIIQYCFLSLCVSFEDSYVLLTLFYFASIGGILTEDEICISLHFLFQFASTKPTQNKIKKIKMKKVTVDSRYLEVEGTR